MSVSTSLSRLSFDSEIIVHFMRRQGGWSLFAAGLALIQVVFTAGVLTDVLLKMFEPTLLKLGFTAAKIWLSLLAVGSVGALFLEAVMFFFIINFRPAPARNMAIITGGIGLFSKVVGSLSLAAPLYGIGSFIVPYNAYLALIVLGTIYSIKEIAFLFNEASESLQHSKALEEATKDKLIEVEMREIKQIK